MADTVIRAVRRKGRTGDAGAPVRTIEDGVTGSRDDASELFEDAAGHIESRRTVLRRSKVPGAGLLLAYALGLAPGTSAGQVSLEHWTHRGGPYHWMGIRPVESRIERKGDGIVQCVRDQKPACASMPVFLMDCKAPAPDEAGIPLHGSLHFKALPGNPGALHFTNPMAWALLWKTAPYYKGRVEVTLERSGRPPVRFAAIVTRERWAYSTNTAYEVTPLPINEIAEVLAEAGNAVLRIENADILVQATFELSGRTGKFLNACDPDRAAGH